MDKKSKILNWLVLMAIIVSIVLTYYRYVSTRNFDVIEMQAEQV